MSGTAPPLVLQCYECEGEIRSPKPVDFFLWDDGTVRPMCSECLTDHTPCDIRVKTMVYRKPAHYAKPVDLAPPIVSSSAQR